jgi:hypothetical protein
LVKVTPTLAPCFKRNRFCWDDAAPTWKGYL